MVPERPCKHGSISTTRDVQALPNGNTLVAYSNSGTMVELDPNQNVVQTPNLSGLGYADWRASLYGAPDRLQTETGRCLTGSRRASDGAVHVSDGAPLCIGRSPLCNRTEPPVYRTAISVCLTRQFGRLVGRNTGQWEGVLR